MGCDSPADFQREGVEYLLPAAGLTMGYQAIIPGMRFDCHGYVTNWSALFALDGRFVGQFTLSHQMYFQLWRPVVRERELTYERVDDDYILLSSNSQELEDVDTSAPDPNSETVFLQLQSRPGETESRMYFEPGDVIGFFVPQFTSIAPLGVTFRQTAASNASTNIYSYKSDEQLCQLSECGEGVTVHGTVVPQISVNYGEIRPYYVGSIS